MVASWRPQTIFLIKVRKTKHNCVSCSLGWVPAHTSQVSLCSLPGRDWARPGATLDWRHWRPPVSSLRLLLLNTQLASLTSLTSLIMIILMIMWESLVQAIRQSSDKVKLKRETLGLPSISSVLYLYKLQRHRGSCDLCVDDNCQEPILLSFLL